jgi:hypothetical protein
VLGNFFKLIMMLLVYLVLYLYLNGDLIRIFMGADPYELRNLIGNLPPRDEDWMLAHLLKLRTCRGREECGEGAEGQGQGQSSTVDMRRREEKSLGLGGAEARTTEDTPSLRLQPSIWEKIFGT